MSDDRRRLSIKEKKITPRKLGIGGNDGRRQPKDDPMSTHDATDEMLLVVADCRCRGRGRLWRKLVIMGKEWLKWVSLHEEPRLLEWTWVGHDRRDWD